MKPAHEWVALLAAALVSVLLLGEALLPFVAAAIIAYLLNPVATRLESLGLSRLAATLGLFALLVLAGLILVVAVAPLVIDEVLYLFEKAPEYVRQLQHVTSDPGRPWLTRFIGNGLGHAERALSEFSSLTVDWLETFVHSAWSGGQELISIFSTLVVVPIVACYLLLDWPKIMAFVDGWIPAKQRATVRALSQEIDQKISGFVVGQSALCLVLMAYYAAALSAVGLHHGLVVGIGAGILNFVPYLGSITGLVIASIIALAQWGPSNWLAVLLVPAIFFVGQLMADYVLSPYLIGRRVELGPVWVIFSLFASGKLFGLPGLLIAVPLAAALGVVFRFLMKAYGNAVPGDSIDERSPVTRTADDLRKE